jgi:DNA-binding NarL/FixJ family response regulator
MEEFETMGKVTVIIADDHGIVRKGIRALIQSIEELELVGEAADGTEALKLVEHHRPDVLLIDISMPGLTGMDVLEKVMEEGWDTRVVILSMHNDEEYVMKAVSAGASGYLLKNADDRELIEGIRAVAKGQVFYSSDVSKVMINRLLRPKETHNELLTVREKEVLGYIVDGMSNKQIADKAFISARTVDKHRASVMKKLEAKNAADLVRITIEKKWLD